MSKLSKTPKAAAASKAATATGGAGGAKAKKGNNLPLLIGLGVLGLVILIFLMMFLGGNKKEVEQKTEVVIPQSDEMNTGDAPLLPPEPEYPEATVENNPFTAPDPAQAITEEAVTKTLETDPSYTQNVGITMPDGTEFRVNTAEFNALKQEIGAPVHTSLSSLLTSENTDMGPAWFYSDVQKTGEKLPLASTEVQSTVMNQALQMASGELQQIKDRYSAPAQQVQVIEQQPVQVVEPQVQVVEKVVEVSSINDEERQLLTSIIQELRTQNKNTRSELQSAKEDRRSVEKELVQLRQRVEDNPALKNVVRATMLPASTGYKLDAVMGDKIFLRNTRNDEVVILQKGQSIPETTYRIDSADVSTGVVLVMPGKK